MSKKAIVVVDIPEGCDKCPHSYDGLFCLNVVEPNDVVIGGEMWKEIQTKEKPDWCPLKPLPQKKSVGLKVYEDEMFNQGFNACIDEILGEQE